MDDKQLFAIKRKAQKFLNRLDRIIDKEKLRWPQGTEFGFFYKDELPDWKGVEGKYLKIGLFINPDLLERQPLYQNY